MVHYGPLCSPDCPHISFVLFLDQKEHFYSFSAYIHKMFCDFGIIRNINNEQLCQSYLRAKSKFELLQ